MPTPPGQSTFQLRTTLQEIEPPIWRRILVPGVINLDKLHPMGWTNSHLHCFGAAGKLYGTHFDDFPNDEIDEHEVSVLQALRDHKKFVYEYDFGDSGDHEVEIEDFTWSRLARAQVRRVLRWRQLLPA